MNRDQKGGGPMNEIYVSTDVEADGPIPGPNSMLSFASAAYTDQKKLLGTFSANLANASRCYARSEDNGMVEDTEAGMPPAQRRSASRSGRSTRGQAFVM